MRSFGTEGRELLDTTGASTFVPPQDVVHAYLLFRGQDIKDLHVHEKSERDADNNAVSTDEREHRDDATEGTAGLVDGKTQTPSLSEQRLTAKKIGDAKELVEPIDSTNQNAKINVKMNNDHPQVRGKSTPLKKNSGPKQRANMVGTGASLLSKNMRGGKGDTGEIFCPRVLFIVRY